MGINSYGEAWHLELTYLLSQKRRVTDYLESELERIDRALGRVLDALESDSTLGQRREAFIMIQELYNPDRLLSQMYPPESVHHSLADNKKG